MRKKARDKKYKIIKAISERPKKSDKKIICPNGNKVSYNTRKKALKALDRTKNIALKDGRPAVQRIYTCHACGLWHLTKETKRNTKAGKRAVYHVSPAATPDAQEGLI